MGHHADVPDVREEFLDKLILSPVLDEDEDKEHPKTAERCNESE